MKKAVLITFLSFLFYFSYAQLEYSIFSEQDTRGLKNTAGEILIPANYDSLGWSQGLQLPVNDIIGYHVNHWGLLSLKNSLITEPKYYHLWAFHKDLIIASVKGKFSNHLFYGALNSKGNAIIEFKYSSMVKKGNNLIISEEREGRLYYGLINQKNKRLLDVKYLSIEHYTNELFIFSNENNKKGLINSDGKVLIVPSLDSIALPQNGHARIFDKGKQGLIDELGKVLISPLHKSISIINDSTADVNNFQHWSFLSASNNVLENYYCDSVVHISNKCLLVYRNGHLEVVNGNMRSIWDNSKLTFQESFDNKLILSSDNKFGCITTNGVVFIPFKYDSIYTSKSYFYLKEKRQWTIWNKFGRQVSKFKYDDIKSASENIIGVKRRGYWGFMDFQGEEIIPLKFDDVYPFVDRLAKVSYLKEYGVINQFGDWICQPIYEDIEIDIGGFSKATDGNRIDIVEESGNIIFQTFNALEGHDSGFLESTIDSLRGLVYKSGNVILHPECERISRVLSGERIFVKKGTLTGILTASGDWDFYLSDRYEDFLGLNEEYYAVKIDGKYGFVDDQERLRISNRYDSVGLFHDGMAAIKLQGKWGFINKAEQLKVQPYYKEVSYFINGLSIVNEADKIGLINKNGTPILPVIYDRIERLKSNGFLIKKGTKYGWLDKVGAIIVPAEYDSLLVVTNNRLIAKRRGKYGLLNDGGLYSIPLIYDQIKHARKNIYFGIKKLEREVLTFN
jgi:hypothetical protein